MKIISVSEVTDFGLTQFRIVLEDGTEWTAPLDIDGEMRRAIDRFLKHGGEIETAE